MNEPERLAVQVGVGTLLLVILAFLLGLIVGLIYL
jgi:hypothetical protein